MEWKYKIWLLLAGAVFTVWLASGMNKIIAILLLVFYIIFFPLTIKKQFFGKTKHL